MKPLIAIACRRDTQSDLKLSLNQNYSESIIEAGGIPLLVLTNDRHDIAQILAKVSGVLIPGGVDVDPKRYDQTKSDQCGTTDAWQDDLDINLIELALKMDMPVFGICRGIQSINVALGGTLIQDIPSAFPKTQEIQHSSTPENLHIHKATTKENTRIRALLDDELTVNTYHHQAVDRLGKGLTVSALSEDGLVEAVEGENIIAVQWHPERMEDKRLFKAFIDDAFSFKKNADNLHIFEGIV